MPRKLENHKAYGCNPFRKQGMKGDSPAKW